MRTIALVFVLLALSAHTSFAEDKVEALVQMTERSQDAADAALQVLYDLRQANSDAQDTADATNKTQQDACDSEIADLHEIATTNKDAGQASTDHRKYLEKEIADTQAYLEWIVQRRIDIDERQEELQDERCYSAQIFVRALKEHSDALAAIDLLRKDLLPAAEKSDSELVQIKDATEKLSAYKHLFNEQAITQFEELANTVNDPSAEDNQKAGLELMKAANNAAGRNIGNGGLIEQISDLLDHLEEHLENSITTLEQNEVQAAWDLAVWLQDSEDEKAHLDQEEERRVVYLDKVNISVQAARAHENKAWEIYFQSATAYNNAVIEC